MHQLLSAGHPSLNLETFGNDAQVPAFCLLIINVNPTPSLEACVCIKVSLLCNPVALCLLSFLLGLLNRIEIQRIN